MDNATSSCSNRHSLAVITDGRDTRIERCRSIVIRLAVRARCAF
ncbi:hypothetical protein X011_04370 [Mycobacterium tuberculosis variant microti OV254]|nr:hypothetical protein X011_04370 [Mycobacterium tuberculosis variant microti OV254]